MRAARFHSFGGPEVLRVEEVPWPHPERDEVLIRVYASSVNGTDLALRQGGGPLALMVRRPFTVGLDVSGEVVGLGPGVTAFDPGDRVFTLLGHRGGGMAEYVTVPARNLVPLGDADPVAAAPLADAGLTPYHAIKLALPHLAGGGRSALVIGLGGLGQIGVQILRALTGATIIATDMKPEAMAQAEKFMARPPEPFGGRAGRTRSRRPVRARPGSG